jgi:hypothetical protein
MAIVRAGYGAHIDLAVADEFPVAQAFVVIFGRARGEWLNAELNRRS